MAQPKKRSLFQIIMLVGTICSVGDVIESLVDAHEAAKAGVRFEIPGKP